ncbi:hypothetical protein GCM10011331_23640 [Flavimobilis marinus]|uniref:MT0933-like antitoxin protein n=1 Tax=Flavimobilis marinus TaxID=285351 RepID=A0A1I2GKF3_9MICO|nr:Rv0909 family putative TA system antitoxin [Flavimobilis marinus]GHG56285.1 hypothetical protein GCM10011331_23640 [Flavimobilis marinus]SFF17519.1 MT0933-like antitoxin protein [Flavimobilis marinus]
MGIDDMKEKASDAGIQKAGDAAEQKAGSDHADKIDKGEQAADKKIGG